MSEYEEEEEEEEVQWAGTGRRRRRCSACAGTRRRRRRCSVWVRWLKEGAGRGGGGGSWACVPRVSLQLHTPRLGGGAVSSCRRRCCD